MVRLLSLAISNLYSYDQTGGKSAESEPINFSNVNVIAGPNDSGKSNIFRAIQLLVDSLRVDRLLTDSDTFSSQSTPRIEAKFQLSNEESEVLLDFLGVYTVRSTGVERTYVHTFKNREALLDAIKELPIELTWQPSNNGQLYPLAIFHFQKLGLKIQTNAPSGAVFVTPEFPFKGTRRAQEGFPEFLDKLVDEKHPGHQEAVKLRDSSGWDFTILALSNRNVANPIPDRARIERLQSFAGLQRGTSNDLSFSQFVAAIFTRSLVISTGGTIFHKKISLIGQAKDTTQSLDQMLRDSTKTLAPLDYDGWNLAEYLYNLKNSVQPQERDRFRTIQGAFSKIFRNLSFDVILQPIRFPNQILNQTDDSRYPSIVINDARNSKQFFFDRVGAGISETLFLLAAIFGSNNSIVLLDEPAVNLHPPHMKALFQMMNNISNQLIVITHSPTLLRNLLFDKGASIIYVRRPENKSVISVLDAERIWTDTERYKLSFLIDTRIFFARHVLLCEGESDKEFLETAAEALGLNPDAYEDVVVDARGKLNLPKYGNLLERFGIPFVVVADGDRTNQADLQSRAASYQSGKEYTMIDSGQFPSSLSSKVFFFKDDVEEFMREQDSKLYVEVEATFAEVRVKATKPAFMHEFVPRLLDKNLHSFDAAIKPLLDYAFEVDAR